MTTHLKTLALGVSTLLLIACSNATEVTNNEGDESETAPQETVASAQDDAITRTPSDLQNDESGTDYVLIENFGVKGISHGSPISEFEDRGVLKADVLRTGEGSFDVWTITDDQHGNLGYVMEDRRTAGRVQNITITSTNVQTPDGLRVGSTWAELQEVYPSMQLNGSEIEARVYGHEGRLQYRLDTNSTQYDIDESTIDPETKITEIIILGPNAG